MYMEWVHIRMFPMCVNIMTRAKYVNVSSFDTGEPMCCEKTLYELVRWYHEVLLLCVAWELQFLVAYVCYMWIWWSNYVWIIIIHCVLWVEQITSKSWQKNHFQMYSLFLNENNKEIAQKTRFLDRVTQKLFFFNLKRKQVNKFKNRQFPLVFCFH